MDQQEEPKNTITVLDSGRESDLTPQEIEVVTKYKEDGLPDIRKVTDIQMTKAIDLYLGGKTYHEIARTLGVKKEIVLYLAYKFNWYGTKVEHLDILDASLKERILHAKLVNQDFLLQIQQFFQSKIGRKMTRYMATGDEDIADELNKKDIEYYFKAVDLLDKLTTSRVPTKSPAVGLNLGDQEINIRKIGENEVVITPKQKTAGEMIAELANMKRSEEMKENKKAYDINKKESQTEKEQNNDS